MTAESIFPKVDGDIYFSSELNRINPKLIDFVEQEVNISNLSGTNPTPRAGSVLYPGAGSLQFHDFMQVTTFCQKISNTTAVFQCRLRLSGTDLNITTAIKSIPSTPVNVAFNFNHIYTSGAITASGGDIGTPYAIFLEANENVTNSAGLFGDIVVMGH